MPRQGQFQRGALRRARLDAGLTQSDLARRLGVAGGERVSRWELGLSIPRPNTVLRAAEVLGVDIGDLLSGEGARPELRSLRRSLGLSLNDLAREVHVSKSTISRWESGQSTRGLSPGTVRLLAKALHVDPSVVREAVGDEGER